MKRYLIITFLFLFTCSTNKSIIRDKDVNDFIIEETQSVSEYIPADSVSVKENKTDCDAISEMQKFDFTLFPADTFTLCEDGALTMKITGQGPAEISLSWQDNSGNWKTVKNGSKIDDTYDIFYDSDFVKSNIGVGQKQIKAEILFDSAKEPIILEKTIYIQRSGSTPEASFSENVNQGCEINLKLTSALIFDDIYFDSGQWRIPSYKFNSNYSITIAKIVKVLKTDPNIVILLTGYSDYSGSESFNLQISYKRCETVKNLILDFFQEYEKSRYSNRIFIESKGEQDFVIRSDNEAKNRLNRRVSISLSYDMPERVLTLKQYSSQVMMLKDVDNQYKQGLKYFYAKEYHQAGMIFNQIAEKYSKHKLADNAKWWQGEIEFAQKNYAQAIEQFKQVFGLGDGNKEAYAQYRIGCCYKEMNLPEKALTELKILSKLYPDSMEERDKAERMIRLIEKK
ncbi:MAG: tetratricopeptide repeat protein [Candidatus Marinimicrobia bacterium]|nr:tetratricopeptide repeat protein [Candidatus Neomarinimicrobiota bacterium]